MDKFRAFMAPNRVVVYLTAAAGLIAAILPADKDLDTTSTTGLIAGLAGIVTIAVTWLIGWQAHEARAHDALQGIETADLPPAQPTDVQEPTA